MGRFHRHDDGTAHAHSHSEPDHEHEHEHEHDSHQHNHDGQPHTHGHDHSHGPGHDHDHAHDEDRAELIGDHSGYATGGDRIEVLERIFDENDHAAAANLATFDEAGLISVNIMSSPGSGKTTLLAKTLEHLRGRRAIGVVEGDIETSIDADRLQGLGAQIALLNTGDGFGGECHLDAPMVARALGKLDLAELDVVLVENVGNLVCPAEFDVGAHRSAMVYAITEGEEKPLKYPVMFRSVELVLVNKMDLLPHLDFDLDLFLRNLAQVNPTARVLEVSARTGEGVDAFVDWLRDAPAH